MSEDQFNVLTTQLNTLTAQVKQINGRLGQLEQKFETQAKLATTRHERVLDIINGKNR